MSFEPCKKCGAMPQVVNIEGLYYVRCTGKIKKKRKLPNGKTEEYTTHCDKWGPYEFLCLTKKGTEDVWNRANSTGRLEDDEI